MIVSAQMQDPVKNENLDLLRCCVSESARVVSRDFRRDRDVTGIFWFHIERRGEGQDIGGLVFATKAVIELLQFRVRRDHDMDGSAQSGGATGARHKAVERQFGHTHNAFL